MKFREYAYKRMVEEFNLDIDSLRAMILKALGGNPNDKDAFNAPLIQFAEPNQIMDRLNTLKGLEQLIGNNPAAVQSIEKAQQTNLTVGQLAGILGSKQ